MGDSRRFDLFACFLANKFKPSKYQKVADVAGGKGYLNLSLKEHGFNKVVTFDPHIRKERIRQIEFQKRLFNESITDDFNLIIGMHPDEATDHIIVQATRRRVPFSVVPCCVKPSAVAFWGKHGYNEWVSHLKSLARKTGYMVEETRLRMNGCSAVLTGFPT